MNPKPGDSITQIIEGAWIGTWTVLSVDNDLITYMFLFPPHRRGTDFGIASTPVDQWERWSNISTITTVPPNE